MSRFALRRLTSAGTARGRLAVGEDEDALLDALLRARALALAGDHLLVHADVRPVADGVRQREQSGKRAQIAAGRCKRWVLRVDTAVGPRVVKISEPVTLGNEVLGLLGSSARREDRSHRRALAHSLSIAEPRGYLELRRGPRLIRALQVQTLVDPEWEPLEGAIHRLAEDWGVLGEALARVHAVPFFHADLKPFHVWVPAPRAGAPRAGDGGLPLRFIDFGRVAFRISDRRRLINLYQALRFIVPDESAAQRRFVEGYCRRGDVARWGDPERVLRRTRAFLRDKLRTHPVVESMPETDPAEARTP